jgi:ATP-dependent Lon protease
VLRKGILELLQQKTKKKKPIIVSQSMIEEWLGVPGFRRDDRKQEDSIGVATGLAWTEVGGDILDIEVTVMKGKGGLTLTGQLGEVMQESAQAAMSVLRSHAKDFGLKPDFYSECDVHVHIPEGAIPKDGPSAGITMTTALTSAFTQIPVRRGVAMTGEVTLRGRVLQIGGLKEKLLAAIRYGITKVIVPKSNMRDVKEFEHELDKKLTIAYAETMDQVLKEALLRDPYMPSNHAKKPKQTKRKNTKKAKKK